MAEGTTRMAEGMLSLSWNNHGAAFSQMLSTLRTKEIYTDVTLACGGKFYPVHKFVLSTCSDYFLEMFEKTTCKHPIVILKDVQCREMEALLSYMYAGIVCVPQSDLAQLIIVAEALQIKGLAVPDETMCANKRMSYTWNPANDSISPHAKRLRPDEGNPGVQYQRFQDGHTVIKPQTLTGIPSFAAGMPTRGYSPTTASPGIRHVQSTVRPTHTATLHSQRYSPYTKETECRQSSSPNSTNKIVIKYTQGKSKADQNQNVESSSNGKQMDTKYATSSTPTFQNNDPEASTSTASQTYSPEMEILPETAVKVELEEGSEPINVDSSGMILFPSSPSDPDSSRRKSISKSHGRASHEKDTLSEASLKKEVDSSMEKSSSNKKHDCLVSTTSSSATVGNNKETQTTKDVQLSAPLLHQEKSQVLSDAGSQIPENVFQCPHCPYWSPLQSNLREHINTHTGASEGHKNQ